MSQREKFIIAMINMDIWETICYEHPSYKIIVKKEEQKENWKEANVIVFDEE